MPLSNSRNRPALKLATWNVNSLTVRLPQVLAWLAAHSPDALCLQETKLVDEKFPLAEIAAAGYRADFFGQKTYNGVALLTREGASDVVKNIPGFDDPMARVITGTVNGIRVIGAYMPNGESPESDKFRYKMRWLDALHDWLKIECARHPRLALLSKRPASDVVRNIPGFDDAQKRVIAGTLALADGTTLRVIGAYFPNGQAPGSEKFDYKMQWLRALREWLRDELAAHPRLVLMGDYNIAPEDRDVYDPVAWAGQILCTDEERAHFQALGGLGLHDAFRLFEQPPKCWSWWDYRMLAFRKNQGLRIDHILVSDALKADVSACVIDKLPRKNERPSDHAPVLVELTG